VAGIAPPQRRCVLMSGRRKRRSTTSGGAAARPQIRRDRLISTAQHGVTPGSRRGFSMIGDDVLRLVFVACHPSYRCSTSHDPAPGRRLTTTEIAYLVPGRRSRSVSCGRRRPSPARTSRSRCRSVRTDGVSSLLEVVYLIFNEGLLASPATTDATGLCGRCARPDARAAHPTIEVHGLVANGISRPVPTRRAEQRAILLLDQDRSRWDAC
jgi:predicted RNA polymerase sigma factor